MFPGMSNFLVSARKYRPVNFDAVVGQPSVTNTLKSAIKTGHVAHAYLFCGPRGVGKTTCARILAKTLNCYNLSENIEACDRCESCKSFRESRSFNIHELDAASNNSVDDIRNLIDKVRVLPQVGKYSIYIIDEVHMLSQAAFNAFLKTLEEPPAHAIFILATTEKHKIIPTILSRCQIFDFHRIRVEDIVKYLEEVSKLENIDYEEEALNIIALKADGALRDALSIFDQVASFSNGNIRYLEVLENLNVLNYEYYFRITEAFLNHDVGNTLIIFDEILQRGFDGQNFIGGLSSHLRDLLVCHDQVTLQLLEISEILKLKYKQQAAVCSADFLFAALEICNQCEITYKTSKNQRLHIELSLIRLCNITAEKKKLSGLQITLSVPDLPKPGKPTKSIQVQKTTESLSEEKLIKEQELHYNSLQKISIKDALKSAEKEYDDASIENNKVSAQLTHKQINKKTIKPISEQFLSLCWDAYASQIREDKPRMSVALKNIQPKVEDGCKIVIELNNRFQLEDFTSTTKAELEKFLRREMQNDLITVEASLIESTETPQKKLYTNEEKFSYLSQKNPLLHNFRKDLNLELE
jgi:DNA polymerase-3 subunit gamma/tau